MWSWCKYSFFKSLGCTYKGIEGSETKVGELNDTYADEFIKIECGDFTRLLPTEEEYNLILDRGSITHNNTADILHVLEMGSKVLSKGGLFFGIDWFSRKMLKSLERKETGYRR